MDYYMLEQVEKPHIQLYDTRILLIVSWILLILVKVELILHTPRYIPKRGFVMEMSHLPPTGVHLPLNSIY